MNPSDLLRMIEAHRDRLADRFRDLGSGATVPIEEVAAGLADPAVLEPLPLSQQDAIKLAGDPVPVAYSLDRGDLVILCGNELDAARKRRTMAAEFDQEAADSWIYLNLGAKA
jgi:hypothetical protein